VILLAPQSVDVTWDAIRGALGADVARVDRALAFAFDRCSVDPARVFVSGFSDGGSYALTLGLANGDLFARVVAFSPGFVPGRFAPAGTPRVFVSHGRADEILAIERSGRSIARNLTRAGYDVRYEEFDGRHEVPPRIRDAALDWLLAP
jgi:predicted esterase